MARHSEISSNEVQIRRTELVLVESIPRHSHVRLMEIDLMRGIAVVMMIAFHLTFDLKFFARVSFGLPELYWELMPQIIGFLFISVVGVSAWINYSENQESSYLPIFKRGFKLCIVAAGITLSTTLMMPDFTVYFGVIHCIGVCTLLSYPFLQNRRHNLPLGLSLIAVSVVLWQFHFSFPWLIWLGFAHEKGSGGDWYPLLPWFGVMLTGIWTGEKLYPHLKNRYSRIPAAIARRRLAHGLCFLGRHSLFIYLIHQPMIVGAIQLFMMTIAQTT